MRIAVARGGCEGHGLCGQLASEIYGLDDEGCATFEYESRDVPADEAEAAVAAARVCPVAAVVVRAAA